jgi:hypothetical protein
MLHLREIMFSVLLSVGNNLNTKTRQPLYVQRNTVAKSRNVYTPSANQTACYNFTARERFYGNLMSPEVKKKYYLGLHVKCPIYRSHCNYTYIWDFSTDSH